MAGGLAILCCRNLVPGMAASYRSLSSKYTGTRKQNFPPAASPVHSADKACQLSIMPSGKEKRKTYLKGPDPQSREIV